MSSPDEVQKLANTTDNTLHKEEEEEESWKQVSDKLNAANAETKEFTNLLDSRRSMPKASVAVDLLEDSREDKDQPPSFESDALHSDTSIGKQKKTMERVGQDVRERDQNLAESDMLQNKSDSKKKMKYSSGTSVFVQEENIDSGTESGSEDSDSDNEICLVSLAEWDSLQSHFNQKDECTKPSVDKSMEMQERRGSLNFARECTDAIEPQGCNVDFVESDGTEEDQSHEIVALDCCENNEILVNLEIVPHEQSEQQPLVTQALQLFNEELSKLSKNQEKKKAMTLHIEAVKRVRQKGFGVSKGIKRMGHIPGIQIGDEFCFRAQLVLIGLHSQQTAGIDYMKLNGKRCAISVVNSWCYENEARSDDTLIYSGHGGNPKISNKSAEDQKLEKGNLALHNSMEMRNSVRVIQRHWLNRKYVYVYYGLYKVAKFMQKRVDTRKWAFKFELQRLPDQPKIRSTNVKMGKRTQKAECVLKDISEGKEKHPVGVFKAEDDDDMPLPFTYITKNVYPDWYQPVDPVGCNCIDGCSNSEQCPCVKKNGGEIPFNKKGALLSTKHTVVYECGPSCKCPSSCSNRVSQHAPPKQFEIFKTQINGLGCQMPRFYYKGKFHM